jgi:DNA-binding MarR family transcriptional regulator
MITPVIIPAEILVSTRLSSTLVGVGQDNQATQPRPALAGGSCPPDGFAELDGAGECSGGVDLGGLGETESSRALMAQTSRFTGSFLRWLEGRTCDGMSHARLALLQALQQGGPGIMRDVGTQLGVTARNMTAMVDALEAAGLVARQPHPTDRRATLIELTPAGQREAAQELGPRLDAMSEIFAELSQPEREQFSGLLTKLMHAIKDRLPQC